MPSIAGVPVASSLGLPPAVAVLLAALAAFALLRIAGRIGRALFTLPARSWLPRVSRVLSRLLGRREYADHELPGADGAPREWIERRRVAFEALAASLQRRFADSAAWGEAAIGSFSDLRFTDAARVPFPFAAAMRRRFNLCSVVTASDGPRLQTLDGHWTLDVSGSYGVNVAGYDRYKEWIERGWRRVDTLGPVLGPLHPLVAENVKTLKAISGLDEVSFHMSGTEAVMAAARMVRFNTKRKLIVCFAGAYHGWWDGVQPGLGSERGIDDCLTLKDMKPASLKVIRRRAKEIAAVFVNPVQSFHPNTPPPNDAVLLASGARSASDACDDYADWLHQLRELCSEVDVPLVFDEVYTGFRLAPGGAQEFFDVHADMVVYGKTVAGGLPIGVVCGRTELMRRFDPERPMRMAYVVGTFSAHPAVMGSMREFLDWVVQPEIAALYEQANDACTEWARSMNRWFTDQALPVRVATLGTVWTVLYTEPSRFNWMLQYYLRDEGLTLSWVGTGRCLCGLDWTPAHYDELTSSMCAATTRMKRDGWWLSAAEFPERARQIQLHLIGDMMQSFLQVPPAVSAFYQSVMKRKEDDHHASHNDATNQLLHLFSSTAFIVSYVLAFSNLTLAMWIGVPALLIRQFGHAVLEPACHEAEKLLLGYDTRTKTAILFSYLGVPIADAIAKSAWNWSAFLGIAPLIALQWFWFTMTVVGGRVFYLWWKHDFGIAMIWLVKLVTDPFTDLASYRPWRTGHAA
jgi:glutamate-1-semialdehyde 2,1-aminomutase